MNKDQFLTKSLPILKKHNLSDWKISLSRMNSAFAVCKEKIKTIKFDSYWVENSSWEELKDVLLHEIAHALTPGHRHDDVWKQMARKIGMKAEFDDIEMSEGKMSKFGKLLSEVLSMGRADELLNKIGEAKDPKSNKYHQDLLNTVEQLKKYSGLRKKFEEIEKTYDLFCKSLYKHEAEFADGIDFEIWFGVYLSITYGLNVVLERAQKGNSDGVANNLQYYSVGTQHTKYLTSKTPTTYLTKAKQSLDKYASANGKQGLGDSYKLLSKLSGKVQDVSPSLGGLIKDWNRSLSVAYKYDKDQFGSDRY